MLLVGIVLSERHPNFTWSKCTKSGCIDVHGFLVHDRHINNVWDRENPTYPELDYEKHIGVTVSADGKSLTQRLVSHLWDDSKTVGSRLYIVTSDDKQYELFKFVNHEFTYTVDMSQIECGMNAALYTVEMKADGTSPDRETPGGVQYGYGYCDANCVDGGCCMEFDIQEASKAATVFTTHSCQSYSKGCDTSGCGYNPYRDSKQTSFWGVGGTVDVSKPVTVVTQFIGSGSSLTEVKRKYVQGGKVIESPGSLTDKYCCLAATQNKDCDYSGDYHSLNTMGGSMNNGHVVVFSLWDSNGMNWMDGGSNGGCTSYNIESLESSQPNLKVVWSDVKFGDLDSTY